LELVFWGAAGEAVDSKAAEACEAGLVAWRACVEGVQILSGEAIVGNGHTVSICINLQVRIAQGTRIDADWASPAASLARNALENAVDICWGIALGTCGEARSL
jgi:hypothetical protein